MCIIYDTCFRNNLVEIETQILIGENNSKYLSPMVINGIIVDTDGFEVLSIEQSENYTVDQLKIFDYEIKNKAYILKNYNLKTIIPINIYDRIKNKSYFKNLIIEMNNYNNETIRKLEFLDEELVVNDFDLLGAFEKLFENVKQNYMIKICAVCKKSSWHPYGRIDFFNHLCFKEFAIEYYKMCVKDKTNVWSLMDKNAGKYKNVYLTSFCNEYEE